MENYETICGIPAKILSKSFPGVHPNLFKFLFKNEPIVEIVRISPIKDLVKIEPEIIISDLPPSDSDKFMIEHDQNLINLGEVQIPDVKYKDEFLDNVIDTEEEFEANWRPGEVHDSISDKDFSSSSNNSEIEFKRKLSKKKPGKESMMNKAQCNICNKLLCSKKYLKIHKETHRHPQDRERPFKCPEEGCDKAYFKSSHLTDHKRNYHNMNVVVVSPKANLMGEKIGDFQCPKCEKKMIKTKHKTYKSHVMNCKPNQMCEFCPKIFNSGRELQKHRNTHTKERSYECGDCDAVFYRTECLLVHRKLHSKERPFPCKIPGCKYSFTTNASLNRHFKICHKDEKKEFKI